MAKPGSRHPVVENAGASRPRRAPRSHHRHHPAGQSWDATGVPQGRLRGALRSERRRVPGRNCFVAPETPAHTNHNSSPIYGMPIIDADRARTVLVLKRSLAPGFAGIENSLFSRPNTRLLLGDAKASLQALIAEFKNT